MVDFCLKYYQYQENFSQYFVLLKIEKPSDLIKFTRGTSGGISEETSHSASRKYISPHPAAQKWEERKPHYFDIRDFFPPK